MFLPSHGFRLGSHHRTFGIKLYFQLNSGPEFRREVECHRHAGLAAALPRRGKLRGVVTAYLCWNRHGHMHNYRSGQRPPHARGYPAPGPALEEATAVAASPPPAPPLAAAAAARCRAARRFQYAVPAMPSGFTTSVTSRPTAPISRA
jgi:hypothetical protein